MAAIDAPPALSPFELAKQEGRRKGLILGRWVEVGIGRIDDEGALVSRPDAGRRSEDSTDGYCCGGLTWGRRPR